MRYLPLIFLIGCTPMEPPQSPEGCGYSEVIVFGETVGGVQGMDTVRCDGNHNGRRE